MACWLGGRGGGREVRFLEQVSLVVGGVASSCFFCMSVYLGSVFTRHGDARHAFATWHIGVHGSDAHPASIDPWHNLLMAEFTVLSASALWFSMFIPDCRLCNLGWKWKITRSWALWLRSMEWMMTFPSLMWCCCQAHTVFCRINVPAWINTPPTFEFDWLYLRNYVTDLNHIFSS